jgi:GMP synthase (glutamine-hydrolysing)
MSETFDPKVFVDAEVERTKKSISKDKALVAVSGGVDSTTCAVLTHRAMGKNLVCAILDDAFMREGEPEHVAKVLSEPPFNVPMKIVDVRDRFQHAMKGLRDAEEKRKMFRATFYEVLSETARKEGCKILVQGTIRADIMETVSGIKTQHNVLEQMGIDTMESFGFKVVEPLVALFKEQVRTVARYLGLPKEFSERQPFPGPGLSVRVVGEIMVDKLETVRKATAIVESELAKLKPSQYFAVILDDEASEEAKTARLQETAARLLNVPSRSVEVKIFRDKATGVERGKRRYGDIVGLKVQAVGGQLHQAAVPNVVALQAKIITENPAITRVFYAIKDSGEKKPYVVGIRAVQTRDFLTASVSEIPWSTLNDTAVKIVEKCPKVSSVYYDVTPKPPATIEME